MENPNNIKSYKSKIMLLLAKNGKKPSDYKDILGKSKIKKRDAFIFSKALDELIQDGTVFRNKRGLVLSSALKYFPAVVSRLSKTFGFVERLDDKSEVFIPGKFLMGAIPGDKVLVKLIVSRTGSPEGEVVSILQENKSQITGVVVKENNDFFILPDTLTKNLIRLINDKKTNLNIGDKILAEIVSRGARHSDHKAKILISFGSSEKASSCAMSVLTLNNINPIFPQEVIDEAKKIALTDIHEYDFKNRVDLRNEIIFTIDSVESKDLDDAISIKKTSDGYLLSVHIADVSHYVKGNSHLDNEALKRGTSVYYANKVVPMLPKELSNGICSLNPQENRLTFSVDIKVSANGEILSYKFYKSVICSEVKGIYSEINKIIKNEADEELLKKYEKTIPSIFLMNELADILIANRKKRGSPQLETSESKLIINEEDFCIDVVPRTRGKSEQIIEEFMLYANECAAKFSKEKDVPFVYRVHENPSIEKVTNMKAILTKLNITIPDAKSIKPAHYAEILENNKDNEKFPVINQIILRSMAKAKYSASPIGHFGLALEDYSHFTSPIRRYPDLAIHRILTDMISGYDKEWLTKRYETFATHASERSTHAELNAMKVERSCEDCYKAEYMSKHIGEAFDGIISSVTEFGFYVELPNTVEGLVHINSLPKGNYSFDGALSITDDLTGKKYSLGESISVTCTKANINSGQVDFSID